jgi:hypothetical protein
LCGDFGFGVVDVDVVDVVDGRDFVETSGLGDMFVEDFFM